MLDQYNREIDYLRLSVTDLCNLKCKYCMPPEGAEKKTHDDILSFESCVQIVKAAADLGIRKIRLTGGEPLIRRDLPDLIWQLSRIEGIEEIAMTTNGILLPKYAKSLKAAGLNRVNISLDTFNPIKFDNVTRGGKLSDVLAGIEAARAEGLLPIKINVVLLQGFNTDEIEDFINFASEDVEVRFIELMPFGEASKMKNSMFVSNEQIIARFQNRLDMKSAKSSGSALCFDKAGDTGRVGFINPISNHFCRTCNRIRVTPDGMLKTCLHSNVEYDLKAGFESSDDSGQQEIAIREIIKMALAQKPEKHLLNTEGYEPIERCMNRIGG